MKPSFACFIASFLLLSFIDLSYESKGYNHQPKQIPHKPIKAHNPNPYRPIIEPKPKPKNQPPSVSNQQHSSRCGPGGTSCLYCPEEAEFCSRLLGQLQNLRNKINRCVCGKNPNPYKYWEHNPYIYS